MGIWLFFGGGCAQVLPPEGGPPDRTPPTVAQWIPSCGKVSQIPEHIEVRFTEPVRILPARFQWSISPDSAHFWQWRIRFRKMEFIRTHPFPFPDSFLVLQLVGGISDVTEGNEMAPTSCLWWVPTRPSPDTLWLELICPEQQGIWTVYPEKDHSQFSLHVSLFPGRPVQISGWFLANAPLYLQHPQYVGILPGTRISGSGKDTLEICGIPVQKHEWTFQESWVYHPPDTPETCAVLITFQRAFCPELAPDTPADTPILSLNGKPCILMAISGTGWYVWKCSLEGKESCTFTRAQGNLVSPSGDTLWQGRIRPAEIWRERCRPLLSASPLQDTSPVQLCPFDSALGFLTLPHGGEISGILHGHYLASDSSYPSPGMLWLVLEHQNLELLPGLKFRRVIPIEQLPFSFHEAHLPPGNYILILLVDINGDAHPDPILADCPVFHIPPGDFPIPLDTLEIRAGWHHQISLSIPMQWQKFLKYFTSRTP